MVGGEGGGGRGNGPFVALIGLYGLFEGKHLVLTQ